MPTGAHGEASALSKDSIDVEMVDSIKDQLFENSRDAMDLASRNDGTSVKAKPNDFAFKEDEEGIRLKFKPYGDII